MEISGKSGYSDPEIYFHLMLSKISQMEGDLEGSIREMEQASHLAGIIPPVMIRENVIAQQVRVDLATDRLAAAEQLLEAEGFRFGKTFDFPALAPEAPVTLEAGLLYNSALRVLLYHAKKEQDPSRLRCGIDLAERVFQGERQCQHLPVALETLLLLSQMYAVLGDAQKSLTTAAKALELAEPEGFISPFIEEGKPVADILAELLKGNLPENVRPAYIQQLLAAYPNPLDPQEKASPLPAAKSQAAGIQPLVEPLSARELEVLQLIANGELEPDDCRKTGDHGQCGEKAHRQYLRQAERQQPHPGHLSRPPVRFALSRPLISLLSPTRFAPSRCTLVYLLFLSLIKDTTLGQ